jgi:hypothetical protein
MTEQEAEHYAARLAVLDEKIVGYGEFMPDKEWGIIRLMDGCMVTLVDADRAEVILRALQNLAPHIDVEVGAGFLEIMPEEVSRDILRKADLPIVRI